MNLNGIKTIEDINKNIMHKYEFLVAIQVCIIWISLSMPIIQPNNFYRTVVGCGFFCSIIIIGLFVKANIFKEYRVKKSYFILLSIIGCSFLFNGVYYSVLAYLLIGVVFCIIIPLQNVVFFANARQEVLEKIAMGILISFIVFIIISIIIGPALGRDQYESILVNPNTLGNYMIIVTSASLFMIYSKHRSNSKHIYLYYIILSLDVIFAIYSNSRSSMIAIFIQFFAIGVILILQRLYFRNWKGVLCLLRQGVLFLILTTVLFFTMFFVLTDVKKAIIRSTPDLQIAKQYEDITLEDMLSRMSIRYTKGIKTHTSEHNVNNLNNDEFTSGRKDIWKQFINNIGFMGHKEEGRKIIEANRAYQNTNAHNVYIQVGYSAGAIAGVAMILLMLLVAKDLVVNLHKFIMRKIAGEEFIFILCSALGFAVVSLTSGGYMLYTYLPSTVFYFSLFILSVEERKRV